MQELLRLGLLMELVEGQEKVLRLKRGPSHAAGRRLKCGKNKARIINGDVKPANIRRNDGLWGGATIQVYFQKRVLVPGKESWGGRKETDFRGLRMRRCGGGGCSCSRGLSVRRPGPKKKMPSSVNSGRMMILGGGLNIRSKDFGLPS